MERLPPEAELTADDWRRQFQALLPYGEIWPREPDATQSKALGALAGTYQRLAYRDGYLLVDTFPSYTNELLAEWERTLGLPDPCTPLNPTLQQRKAAVAAKVIGSGGQSIPYFTAVAAALGFTVTVTEYAPFRAGISTAGSPAYGPDWAHTWQVDVPETDTMKLLRRGRLGGRRCARELGQRGAGMPPAGDRAGAHDPDLLLPVRHARRLRARHEHAHIRSGDLALKTNWQSGDRLGASDLNGIGATINQLPRQPGLIIPYYLFPSSVYTNTDVARLLGLIRKYHNVPVIVVANPTGPGITPPIYDLNWEVFIRQAKGAGATVVGYVATGDLTSGSWVGRSQADVQSDIDAWRSVYANSPIDGIFLDVLPFDPGTGNANVTTYLGYRTYCNQRNLYPVIANPGSNNGSAWFDTPVADALVIWEGSTLPDETNQLLQDFVNGYAFYPYSGRGAIVYGQSSLDVHFLRRLRRYVQWLYVTDASGANPYGALPSYLEQLFAAMSDAQTPGRGITALTWGTSIAWNADETNVATVTLTGNGTLAFPTNLIAGNEYTLIAQQDATGSRNLAFASGYKFTSGIVLPLTATANKFHVVRFMFDGTSMFATSVNTY